MGFLDSLLGRSKPVKPDLDALFAVPTAALTLQAATGLAPTGLGSVCVKEAEGADFARAQRDILGLLHLDDDTDVDELRDDYGYLWTTCRAAGERLPDLVTALHATNSTYADAGFGPGLLCSLVGFRGEVSGRTRSLALVYLYKRGTFYPFAPLRDARGSSVGTSRDTSLELQVRGVVEGDLPVEQDTARWFPVWGAPGL